MFEVAGSAFARESTTHVPRKVESKGISYVMRSMLLLLFSSVNEFSPRLLSFDYVRRSDCFESHRKNPEYLKSLRKFWLRYALFVKKIPNSKQRRGKFFDVKKKKCFFFWLNRYVGQSGNKWLRWYSEVTLWDRLVPVSLRFGFSRHNPAFS